LKSLDFLGHCFVARGRRNNCRWRRNHFPFWRRYPETTGGYQIANETAGTAGTKTGDSQMRTISFILAFAFVLAGPSMADSADNGLPGIGTFAYHGSPVTVAASRPLVLAAK
jgi:hypothetical protein